MCLKCSCHTLSNTSRAISRALSSSSSSKGLCLLAGSNSPGASRLASSLTHCCHTPSNTPRLSKFSTNRGGPCGRLYSLLLLLLLEVAVLLLLVLLLLCLAARCSSRCWVCKEAA
jgi:hypothetical protein